MLREMRSAFARGSRRWLSARGSFAFGHLGGIPVLVHWTTPLTPIVLGDFRFVPAFWIALVGLILVHELGHALAVRAAGATVTEIRLDGAGGQCAWRGSVTRAQRAGVAWGGVLAQLLVLGVGHALALVLGEPSSAAGAQVLRVATSANLYMIAFNLLPVGDLDGVEAWPGLRDVWRAAGVRRAARRRRRTIARLARLDEIDDDAPFDPEVEKILRDLMREPRER